MKEKSAQEEAWDEIAKPWKEFRTSPLKEVKIFLKQQRGRILDMCCGSGRNFIKTKGIMYGIDFSSQQVKYAKKYAKKANTKVIVKKAYAYDLPFEDEFFDSAIFIASLHCIETAEKRKKSPGKTCSASQIVFRKQICL